MIPQKNAHAVVEGNIDGESFDMAFDPRATLKLMSVMTRLYSDPEGTIIREYSCNARDSHIQAGQTRPIEVSTPTRLNPYLVIRDFGVGLSLDEIRNVYSKYGASTKEASNDFTGYLGLGSKSALAYGELFTVQAVKDGVKTIVNVTRDANGMGNMQVVDTSKTDAHNGVTITIPANMGNNQMERKAEQLFAFWEKGTVLLNGKEPSQLDKMVKFSDRVLIYEDPKHRYSDYSYVVMGGVPYPVKPEFSLGSGVISNYSTQAVVAFVDMGDVNFTPSREELEYTSHTKDTLAKLRKQFAESVESTVRKQIKDAPNYREAYLTFERASKTYHFTNRRLAGQTSPFLYHGHQIPDSYTYVLQSGGTSGSLHYYKENGYPQFSSTPSLTLHGVFVSGVIIQNFTLAKLSRKSKTQIIQHIQTVVPAHNQGVYYLARGPVDFSSNPWLQDVKIVDWADVAAEKIAPSPSSRTYVSNPYGDQYDVMLPDTNVFDRHTLSVTDKIAYYTPQFERDDRYNAIYLRPFVDTDTKIVRLFANRLEKFKRLYPQAQHVATLIKDAAADLKDGLSEDEKTAYGMGSHAQRRFDSLNGFDIHDPAIKSLVDVVVNFDKAKLEKRLGEFNRASKHFHSHTVYFGELDFDIDSLFEEKYPLWKWSHLTESVEYANRKYDESLTKAV